MQTMLVKQSRKEIEWRQRLARFAASGQRVTSFCQAESVSAATFYHWRKQLTGTAGASQAGSFIDAGVMPAASEAQPTQTASAGAALEVRLDLGHGVVLHIVRR